MAGVTSLTLLTIVVASLASLFMAWTIGAGSSGSTPFAPAVGANAISVMRASFIVGLLGFAGATLQGANVSAAVGRELVGGLTLSPIAATTGLLIAALLVAVGVFTGYPIATAFTVTGAIVGTGLALGGVPAWAKYQQIAALWLLTPIIGGGLAYGTAELLRRKSVPDEYAIPVLGGFVGLIIVNVEFVVLGSSPAGRSIASAIATWLSAPIPSPFDRALISLVLASMFGLVVARDVRRNVQRSQRRFLLVLGGLVAFSAGGSQVGLAVGPLLPLLDPGSLSVRVPVTAVLVFGGIGLLAGSWMGAPRMIKALSQDYSSLSPRRSIAALIPSFVIAQTAVYFGIPVSFNEIIVSAIIGSGYVAGSAGVSRTKAIRTVLAWIGSFVIAFGLSYGSLLVFDALS